MNIIQPNAVFYLLKIFIIVCLVMAINIDGQMLSKDRLDFRGLPDTFCFHKYCKADSDNRILETGGFSIYTYKKDNQVVEAEFKPESELYGVYVNSNNVAWAVGSEGSVYRKLHNSNVWESRPSGIDESIDVINCINDNTCWIAGNNGTVLKTIDAGLHWSKVKNLPRTRDNYADIVFLNSNIGWIVTDGGTVFHTTNGGKKWYQSKVEIDFSLLLIVRDATFISNEIGFVSGYGGVAKTTDGGKTWTLLLTEQTIGKQPDFIGLAVAENGKKLWAVGNINFSNYYSEDGGKSWQVYDPK